jgi:hypothetical protein
MEKLRSKIHDGGLGLLFLLGNSYYKGIENIK